MTFRLSRSAMPGAALILLAAVFAARAIEGHAESTPDSDRQSVVFVPQGQTWTDELRQQFYLQDQGSSLIPLAWLKALSTADGKPFLHDQLARYGYLRNDLNPDGLPVGFTTNTYAGTLSAGMSCAACHTRELSVSGQRYRVDGGPAIVDFQAMLTDLVAAAGRANSDAGFPAFADAVLGQAAPESQRQKLHADLALWYSRENALAAKAYPTPGLWGLGRLDAVSMILNRVSALDAAPAPSYLNAANIQLADAPVRYPFLWNAPVQDKTQWPGFADNGDNILGMARNLGEVYGVFANFHPVPAPHTRPLTRGNFRTVNSANFVGLGKLENLISAIGAPRWPWTVDQSLVLRGGEVFNWPTAQGGCVDCHGETAGTPRLLNAHTWKTPLQDVGTDQHEYEILHPTVATGVMQGMRIPFGTPLKAQDDAFSMLGTSVIGALLQGGLWDARAQILNRKTATLDIKTTLPSLRGAFTKARVTASSDPLCNPQNHPYCYEARVLNGIWAAAPYLHNGSVPTLADLLKPASERPASFAVGSNYNTALVGLDPVQSGLSDTRKTTDCTQRNSGISRCGHEFGTSLSAADKLALLEYLKTL